MLTRNAVYRTKAVPYQLGGNHTLPFGMSEVPGVSKDGLAFLKCAFAPPDFQVSSDNGIPDQYSGRTLVKRHRLNTNLVFVNTSDYYILQLPVPGYAFFIANTVAGVAPVATTQFVGVPYSDYAQLFGTITNEANVVDRFRFVSSCLELVPTVNQMTWSGSITTWKAPIRMALNNLPQAGVDFTTYSIMGLQSTTATNPDCFVASFDKGVFTQCFKDGPSFVWSDIIESLIALPDSISANDFGQLTSGSAARGLPGFGNMEASITKISGVTQTETALIRTWACVEYSPIVGSVLYEYARASPMEDLLALKLYNQIAMNLPIGVPYGMNEGTWDRILRIIKSVTRAGAMLPGNYGMGFAGANMMAEALSGLTT